MTTYSQPAIIWPEKYTPGETDNYASNEVIIKDLSVLDVWEYLIDTKAWPTYYNNAENIVVGDGSQTKLAANATFVFDTFGFHVSSKVEEFELSNDGNLARLAWSGTFGEGDEFSDVYHAWLIENLPNNRVRILTEESQIGKLPQQLAQTLPNPMINGHQAWLVGLANSAKNKTSY
ncbi:polyketide cyclase [[Mannheimia] succiniciproducens]|uniref:Polyketide cyclase n=1 Tax=Mannheimia succiniciproducens (strain KCTC 0769BP / MBEL55E) TaxID=221988 RepID=Q65SP9_MANSM|nr:polyketide cyclase [[Mannheimia] succiniciproducens]AAU38011.1 unknown [[Mannheimia] succiniciproducens MBEL55E]